MAVDQYTRCPACRTIYRVTRDQLALRGGQVRCGHCRTVFDGHAQLISLAPSPRDDEAADSAALGPLTVTLRDARALRPANEAPAEAPAPVAPRAPETRADTEPDVDFEHRFAWDKPRKRSRRAMVAYAIAFTALVLLLAAQALHHFRDGIAARWPATRPLLTGLCVPLGCEIRPLREIGFLSIEASGLESDPAHRGLLILTATIRNRAPYAVAPPYVELTLTDPQDRVVVRRAIAPAEYLNASLDTAHGIAGNAEVSVKLFIDASATSQSGYRVYLFYP